MIKSFVNSTKTHLSLEIILDDGCSLNCLFILIADLEHKVLNLKYLKEEDNHSV